MENSNSNIINSAVSTVTQREIAVSGFNERQHAKECQVQKGHQETEVALAKFFLSSEIRKAGYFQLGIINRLVHQVNENNKPNRVTLRSA